MTIIINSFGRVIYKHALIIYNIFKVLRCLNEKNEDKIINKDSLVFEDSKEIIYSNLNLKNLKIIKQGLLNFLISYHYPFRSQFNFVDF